MSGSTARKGFLFQDLYLLLRVLKAASGSLESAWRSGSNNVIEAFNNIPFHFGIEAAAATSTGISSAASLDWDVLVLGTEKLEFAEVKSGAITKDDRIRFWQRLRRELSRTPESKVLFVPILVVDPSKLLTLDIWRNLADIAVAFSGAAPAKEPTGNVTSAEKLLKEALWWICGPDHSSDSSDPPVDFDRAIDTLRRFDLHRHQFQQLELQVTQFIELLFPGGLTDTQKALLLGWLGERATSDNGTRHLFSVRDLLQEIGILQDAISLSQGTLKEWRNLWNEVPSGVRARTRASLGKNGDTVPIALIQPTAFDALNDSAERNLVILGQGGAGKSSFLAQAVSAAAIAGDEVLYCGADDLTLEELEQLIKAIRFSAALMALQRPGIKLFLCIDGLDEAAPTLRKRWAQLLIRTANLSNIKILVSIRDAVWRGDGEVKTELNCWRTISLDLWPNSLVSELLRRTHSSTTLHPTLIELLRTPILLDLFWRTFVEIGEADIAQITRPQTRHGLLAAFWHERLLASPRHSGVANIGSRISAVVAEAATSVGGFLEASLDAIGVHTLLSEGVLVREGRLQSRLRFRHPLLRDFALAQWCLETNSPCQLAARLVSIQGGLQRHGVLRAILEALLDSDANIEYPQLELGTVIQKIVTAGQGLASQLAHLLGTQEPLPALNPVSWPKSVQSSLPAEFARDLLSAARLDENSAWATPLEKWPDDSLWMNEDYATEIWRYSKFLSEMSRATPNDAKMLEHAHQAARKLRSLSEAKHFASKFAESERWLKTQALLCVIPTLPDQVTLGWVEREMLQSSWRTRSFLLEQLIHLARIDANRTAVIYRKAVGLTQQNGNPNIDSSLWSGNMDHQAIEWSLGGEDGKRSLLKEYPEAFLPVAVDLAEALWILNQNSPENRENELMELMEQFDPSWSEEADSQLERDRRHHLGDLIDDSPEWNYWRSYSRGEPYQRCIKAIHKCAEYLAAHSPSIYATIVCILKSSRMASIHTVILDVTLKYQKNPSFLGTLRESILDSRLYHVSGVEYWLEQSLMISWPILTEIDRTHVFTLLRGLLENDNLRQFLARLPNSELPDDLRALRPNDNDSSYEPRTRPERTDFEFNDEWKPIESDEPEVEIGEWPNGSHLDLLREFARCTRALSRDGMSVEMLSMSVTTAIHSAREILPKLQSQANILEDASRFWVWKGLARILVCLRSMHKSTDDQTNSVISGCAELALASLKNIPKELPGSLPDEDVWSGHQETCWELALSLANVALTLPPADDAQELQTQFIGILRLAYATENPLVQLVCTTKVQSWHWFRTRERLTIHDEVVWTKPKHAIVLAWSLSKLQFYDDIDRGKVVRLLLSRQDLASADYFSNRLGRSVGHGSMAVYENGQRSTVADIAREAVNSYQTFPLLQNITNRQAFLRGLIFGMKEQVIQVSGIFPQLASDYGDWALKVWKIIHEEQPTGSGSIVLFATHWFQKSEGTHRTHLKLWWRHLHPLLASVIQDGGRPDCFTLLFDLRSGGLNDLMTPEEIIGLITTFAKRLLDNALDLDERAAINNDFNSWRDCANHAAESIDSLLSDGSLKTDLHREEAHKLLSTLAAEPIRSSQALEALHRLHNA